MASLSPNMKKRYGLEYNPIDDIKMIKRYSIQFADANFGDKLGYVIFIRPALNLFMNANSLHANAKRDPFIAELFADPIGRKILYSIGNAGVESNPFLPVIGSRVKSFSPVEASLRIGETGENFIGQKIVYGNDNSAETTAGMISLPITDCSNQIAYKTLKVWKEYIERLSRGEATRTQYDIANNIIDYAGGLYYVITKGDGEILNWWKYYGVFPRDLSPEPYAHQVGNPSPNDMNINFAYSVVSKSMDMIALGELKQIGETYARSSGNTKIKPHYDSRTNSHGDVYVNTPVITRKANRKLYLEWC